MFQQQKPPVKRVSFGKTAEQRSLLANAASLDDDNNNNNSFGPDPSDEGVEYFTALKDESVRKESIEADRLSIRLLAVDDDDDETELKILQETLDLDVDDYLSPEKSPEERESIRKTTRKASSRFFTMTALCLLAFGIIFAALWIGAEFIGPPSQPVGPYQLIERQVRVSVCVRVLVSLSDVKLK